MFIESIRIRNLRGFKDQIIYTDRYTCLVGPNGAGKSTVLCALNIFFRESEGSSTSMTMLDKEDFHLKDTSEPIEITVTFVDLTDDERQEFEGYYRSGKLIVSAKAIFDEQLGHAQVKQFGNRLAIPAIAPFFEALKAGEKVADLKVIFASIKAQFPTVLAAATKDQMVAALRAFEEANTNLCEVIASEDMFYGVGQAGRLRRFVQWVYVPAVKDASAEQAEARNTAFGRLIARTVRSQVNFEDELNAIRSEAEAKYQQLIENKADALATVSASLQQRLAEWSVPNATAVLSWHQDGKSAVRVEEPSAKLVTGDGVFEGNIARFGHGMQRSYLIALLQGLASLDDSDEPILILGCEEPELYQHPPQARHLCSVFDQLAGQNSQVIVTTHSPLFVDGRGFESVRMVRRPGAGAASAVTHMTLDQLSSALAEVAGEAAVPESATLAKLNQALQLNMSDMFFTNKLILVEGLEDQAYLTAWLQLTDRWTKVRAGGCYIMAVGGKSEMARPLAIANHLQIPTLAMFDCDSDKLSHSKPDRAAALLKMHEHENLMILRLSGSDAAAFPSEAINTERVIAWPQDLTRSLKIAVGPEQWHSFGHIASQAYDDVGGMQKNTMHIAVRLAAAFDADVKPEPLEAVGDWIVAFAQS